MSKLGDIYYGLKNKLDHRKTERKIQSIIQSFVQFSEASTDAEVKAAGEYYRGGGKSPFPYESKLELSNPEVLNDGFPYIIHNNKKLYFPKGYSNEVIHRIYRGMRFEQEAECPHCYTQNDFEVPENVILLDLGCAEAMFSLDHVEKVKQLILFETKPEWIEALKKTFEPWSEKVIILQKYASNVTGGEEQSIDDLIHADNGTKYFLKMDVEGAEFKVLNGAKKLLQQAEEVQLAVATYHNQQDFNQFSEWLSERNFEVNHTKGHILFFYDNTISAPFLRRCILQARKNQA